MFIIRTDGSTTLNKDLYINKKTFKCLELSLQESYSLESTRWIKIPDEAEECYYFDGNDPEGVEELCFYKNSLKEVWEDGEEPNFWYSFEDKIGVLKYVTTHGKLVWKRDVNGDVNNTMNTVNNTNDFVHIVADAIHHPKHYTSDDCGIEAIDVTSLLPACISNAVKYVWRCGKKDEDLQELKKALWYINYSIDNDLPSFVDELSDSLEFQEMVEKVKSHWVGNKYMFIDAVYWGNQETMKKALELMIQELTSNQET